MLNQIVLVCVIALMQCRSAVTLECYTCTNTSSLPACTNTITCPVDTVCASEYTTSHGTRVYKLGCKDPLTCSSTPTVSPVSPSIIGRSATTSATCSECCHTNYCNRNACQDVDPKCADDTTFNCATVGAITNICADASHIRPYCRRFCGFCKTVDGGWSHWSQWSLCGVTCGNGTRIRSRNCSDPPPSNGGSDCPGVTHEQVPCSKDLCPVHGGWSSWSEWGSCSASCDIGLQRRDRMCSNPYPARFGEHCFGESRDDRLCFPGACANGGWSSWGPWGACSTTCGGGVQTRSRDCNSPVPSMTGRDCTGDSTHAQSCNTSPCHVVGFSVTYPKMSPTAQQLTFTKVITNKGNNFNVNSGVFTCGTPGFYFFSAFLEKTDSSDGAARCFIRKNGTKLVDAYTQPGVSPYKGITDAANGVYVHLVVGDNVTLGECTGILSFVSDSGSSFSGFLITADDV